MKYSYSKKARIDLADHAGLFALEVAARFGLEAEVRDLLKAGALVDHVSPFNGWTALHWAAAGKLKCLYAQQEGGHKLLFPLLTTNPNHFTKNKEGKEADLPLHVAVFEGHTEAAKELVRLNAGQLFPIFIS